MTPFLLACCFLSAKPATLDIAYVARYYYPYPSEKKSRYFVYLTDLHGTRKVKVSDEPRTWHSQPEFGWLDGHRLAWKRKNEAWEIYDVISGQRIRAKGVRLPVLYAQYIGTVNPKIPGIPQVSVYEKETKKYEWRVFATRLGKTVQLPQTDKENDEQLHSAFGGGPKKTYVVTDCCSANGMWEYQFLYRIDWQTLSAKFIRTGVKAIYVDAGRDLMVCEQRDREMSSYGPEMFVWTTEIYAMKLSKNKLWPVVTGLVDAQRPVIRPMR